jgi:hypothetical protein
VSSTGFAGRKVSGEVAEFTHATPLHRSADLATQLGHSKKSITVATYFHVLVD